MKAKLILLITFIISTMCYSQIDFRDHLLLGHQGQIYNLKDIEIADLDNDGDLDIVSASRGYNKLAWYENLDGQGTFGAIEFIDFDINDTGTDLYGTYISDIDGDGLIDVISNSNYSNEIAWFKNLNGIVQFDSKRVISNVPSGNGYGIPFDLDNDNDIDIISKSDSNLIWYENTDGLGNFGMAIVIPNTESGRVHLTDIDNDGDLDILSSNDNGTSVHWYENLDGQGNFGSQQIISIYGEGGYSIFSADFDNDGDLDVLTSNSNSQTIYWYENLDGEGDFSPLNAVSTTIPNCYSIDAVDVDNDGDNDILSSTTEGIVWFENTNGLGIFNTPQTLVNNIHGPSLVNIADIDGDNDLDIVSSGQVEDAIAWYNNVDGQASFFSHQNITYDFNFSSVDTVFGDIDGDSFLDVITNKYWFKNIDGQGTISYPILFYDDSYGYDSFITSDIDNDNDLDIIGLDYSNSDEMANILWSENISGGNFNNPQTLFDVSNSDNDDRIKSSDLNNDGLIDIIYIKDSGSVSWYQNLDGNGSFGSEQLIASNLTTVFDVITRDIDGDSDLDVLVSYLSNDLEMVILYKNQDGAGNFNSGTIINQETTVNSYPLSIDTADFDGDGDLDLLTSSTLGEWDPDHIVINDESYLAWQENLDGLGLFGVKNMLYNISYDILAETHSFASDLDNDGDIDIVMARGFYEMYWYENTDGLANFNSHEIILDSNVDNTGIHKIQPLDFNNDENIDIIYLLYTSFFGSGNSPLVLHWKENTNASLNIQEYNYLHFSIYPNPVKDNLFIKSKVKINKIEVFNLNGYLIQTYTNKNAINISNLSDGLYFIKILGTNGIIETKKFIKN